MLKRILGLFAVTAAGITLSDFYKGQYCSSNPVPADPVGGGADVTVGQVYCYLGELYGYNTPEGQAAYSAGLERLPEKGEHADQKPNSDKEHALCPLESAADLPYPYTGSAGVSSNKDILGDVLAAIPPAYTGRFDHIIRTQAEEQRKPNEETDTSAAERPLPPFPFRIRF
jgi:hypothetical protein